MTNRASRTEDFIWRRIGDEIVIIGNDGLSLHVLNKTAAQIWEMCDGKKSPDDMTAALCERFEVSFEEASADVRGALVKLEKDGLIKSADGVKS